MDWKSVLLFVHIAAVVVWVGGMFFAYVCLRPVAAEQLPPPQRLPLWAAVFRRFFPWVWAAVVLIFASGLGMILQVSFKYAPLHWHVMFLTGLTMMAIFFHVYFAPFARLGRGVAAQDWPAAAAALNQIRVLVGINVVLGFLTIAVATLGNLIPH
jgi:uncharacterized membrane protein